MPRRLLLAVGAAAAGAAITAAQVRSLRARRRWQEAATDWKAAALNWQGAAEVLRDTVRTLQQVADIEIAAAFGTVQCGELVPDSSCEKHPGRWHMCVALPNHERGAEQHHLCDCGVGWREGGTP